MLNKLQKLNFPWFLVVAGFLSTQPFLLSKAEEKGTTDIVATPEEAAKPQEMGLIVKEVEVRFAGPKTTNDSVILANLRTKVGEPFTKTQSDDDVRSLYATGLFSNVRIFEESMGDGIKGRCFSARKIPPQRRHFRG
jgi:outer membrane protein insertion porin family